MKKTQSILHPRNFIVPNEIRRYGITPGNAEALTYLQVELTDKCNLACQSCPRATSPSSKDILSVSDLAKILNSAPSITQVSFVGGGEAFMLKNFAKYVELCSERGIFSSVNTNGVLVRHRLNEAIDAGLGKIAISVDAADEMLVAIRSGLTRKELESSLRQAVDIVRGKQTRLSAAVTLGITNINQFVDTLRFIASCGICEVTVESIHHWADDKSLNATSLFHNDPARIIPAIERGLQAAIEEGLSVEIFDYMRIGDERVRGPMHCAWPWDGTFVTCKGEVTPCCINLEASDSNCLGRLSEATLIDIWRGSAYTKFREDSAIGRDWSFCTDCVYRMEYGDFIND